MHQNELEIAIVTIKRSIEMLEKVGNPRLLWEAYSTLAITYNKFGRPYESTDSWGIAKSWINKVSDGLSDSELKNGYLKSRPVNAIFSKAR